MFIGWAKQGQGLIRPPFLSTLLPVDNDYGKLYFYLKK